MENIRGNITIDNILNIFSNIGNDIARQIVSFIPVENNQIIVFDYLTQNNDGPLPEHIFDYFEKNTDQNIKYSLVYKIKIFLKGFYQANNSQTKDLINILESIKCECILLEYKNCIGNLKIKEAIEILIKIIYFIKKNKLFKIKQSKGLINGLKNIINEHKNNKKKYNIWFTKLLFFMGMYVGLCKNLMYILDNKKKISDFFNYLIKKSNNSVLPTSDDEKNIYKEVIKSEWGEKMIKCLL